MGCTGDTKQYTDQPRWFDPLGPSRGGKHRPTGGPEMRRWIFRQLPNLMGRGEDLASRFGAEAIRASKLPGWDAAAAAAGRTAAGEYLGGSPYLEAALARGREALDQSLAAQRSRALADYAGASAGAQSAYARSGLAYSTASQQADQASRAALLARLGESESVASANLAAQEAQQRAANYQLERQRQLAAPQTLAAATGQPLEYLSAAGQQQLGPASQTANIIQGLAGQGQIATPQSAYVKQPGALDYTMGFLSSLSGGGMSGGGGGW